LNRYIGKKRMTTPFSFPYRDPATGLENWYSQKH